MMSASAIARLRLDLRRTLTDAATILRPTVTASDDAGESVSWTTVAAGVPCRVRPDSGGGERALPERTAEVTRVEILLPPDTAVLPRDRIAALGQTFEVTQVRAPRTIAAATVVAASVVR
ncbi:MAG: hypothetical protein KatS3mg060_1167 [Dehalococcoidia bacterium]|nr:MAG: hypothetical protein KatS3mg060_1167 [Dehalococcoidia bacterium]